TRRDWAQFFLLTALPWLALYQFTVKMGVIGAAFKFPFEDQLPTYSWTAIAYQSTYLTVSLAPWSASTRGDLRRFMISAWAAMAIAFPCYWIIPSSAPRRPLVVDNWLAPLLQSERNTYPPAAAFPSFHVLWAIFVGRLYRPRWAGITYAATVAVSCVTTG